MLGDDGRASVGRGVGRVLDAALVLVGVTALEDERDAGHEDDQAEGEDHEDLALPLASGATVAG